MEDFYDEPQPLDEGEEIAAAAVESALASGASGEAIVGLAEEYVEQGLDPVQAIEAAAYAYDHSEARDELDVVRKVGEREGWT